MHLNFEGAINPKILASPATLVLFGKAYINTFHPGGVGPDEAFQLVGSSVAKTILNQPIEITERQFIKVFIAPVTLRESLRTVTVFFEQSKKSSYTGEGAVKVTEDILAREGIVHTDKVKKVYQDFRNHLNALNPYQTFSNAEDCLRTVMSILGIFVEFCDLITGKKDLMKDFEKIFELKVVDKKRIDLAIFAPYLAAFQDCLASSIQSDPCDLDGEPTIRMEHYLP